MYEYRVKPKSKPKSNPDAMFKIGDKIENVVNEGEFNPPIFTVKGFDDMGNYLWEETYNRSPIEAIDVNSRNINDVYWWHVIHYHKEDRYTLAPTMMKLGEVKGWANETYSPMFENEYFNEIDNLRVLGNIYENKELINETTKI